MNLLKNLEQDCTYNQTGNVKSFLGNNKNNFYSLDLKNATDRFPSTLQLRLLSVILGDKEKSSNYFKILKGYEFDSKVGKLNYSVGQPMGAYSSWALLSLSHHLIVNVAMMRSESHQSQYMLLGDDLVISGTEFASSYKEIVHDLGMEISEQKTIESKDSFEFAKRFYVKGQE